MDDLDRLLAKTTVDTDVEIPKVLPKGTQKKKEDGQTSSTRMEPKTKPSYSSAVKNTEPKKKRKEKEKTSLKAVSPQGRQGPSETRTCSVDKVQGAGLHQDKKQKSVVAPTEEVTEADFAAVAKVARLGAEAINKMKAAVLVNTPGNLEGMCSETQAYNDRLARKLAWTRLEIKYARREYAELLKENRLMREECDKNSDLLKRLIAAETEAAENKKKAANLDRVSAELHSTRDDLARLRKEAEEAEVKAQAQVTEIEKRCQELKNSNAEMAKLGYTQCLSQVMVLDPDFPAQYVHLTQRVEDGKILAKDGKVVYPPPETEEDAVEEDAGAAGGGAQTPEANQETPKENAGEN